MICISVSPESRTLARVDLMNAAGQGDLVELCLDRIAKEPDIASMIEGIEKPILVSCRREKDGGFWFGYEEDRIARLKAASEAGAAYVEIELEVADQIPRAGKTKRVISFTSTDEPLASVDKIFKKAAAADADIVKFTWPTATLDEAWPLLATVGGKKNTIPAVGIGLGASGLTFSLLGQRYGFPWIYASLERGLGAYDGMPTVSELDELYDWRSINPKTRFVGVVGFGNSRNATVRAFGKAFKQFGLDYHCLPLEIGSFNKLSKMLDILKVDAIVTSRHMGAHILPLAQETDEAAKVGRNADLLVKKEDGWHAFNTICTSAMSSLEARLGSAENDQYRLDAQDVLILGSGRLAQTVAYGVQRRKGLASVSGISSDDGRIAFCEVCGSSLDGDAGSVNEMVESIGARSIPFNKVYEDKSQIVIVADPSIELGYSGIELNPSFLRSSMTVMDVTRAPDDSEIIAEARHRGCKVVEPMQVFSDHLASQFKAITGKDLPASSLL